MNAELFTALELLEKEKGIPAEYMIEKIEAALISAYKKEYGNNTNVRVLIDPVKKDVRVYQQKEVVETVENPETQISLEDARAHAKKYTIGSVVETEVKPKNFRRLSAAAAKSVIIQGIREGERRIQQEAYENKHEEIITATVSKIDSETATFCLKPIRVAQCFCAASRFPAKSFMSATKSKSMCLRSTRKAADRSSPCRGRIRVWSAECSSWRFPKSPTAS